MDHNQHITRRQSLKRICRISRGLAIGSAAAGTLGIPLSVFAETRKERFLVEGIGQKKDYSPKELVKQVFDAAGGIQRFVSKGDVVVVKPNISWARPPHLAATTSPEVLEGVIELCKSAGAKQVKIADNTIHSVNRCFAITGAGMVAKKTGAELIYPRSSLMRDMKISGHRLDVWPVFAPLKEADKVINLPIAKDHGLSGLTLGMKNWIGAVGGRRSALHQDIHQTIVDLAQFFRPVVTLIDATRIMTRNGPSGGSPADVAIKNTLILSDDPVAADAKAAMLFETPPKDIGFISLAQARGLGTYDLQKLSNKRVIL